MHFVADKNHVGQRLDKFLAQFAPINSRTRAQRLLDEGNVFVDGKPQRSSYRVKGVEKFEVRIPQTPVLSLEPFAHPIYIEYEDEDVIVIAKPSGLVVHPAHGHENDTLVNALVHNRKDLSMGFHEMRPGVVHRLDKDTSGLLVMAKNNFAHSFLAEQFKEKSIHRVYLAVTLGHPPKGEGRIESFLARDPNQRKKFASLPASQRKSSPGRWAATQYRVLAQKQKILSLLECRLETGRTHQIRVHLSELKCPIVGDVIYGSETRQNKIKWPEGKARPRLALHAAELGFVHPRSKEKMYFKRPPPPDIQWLYDWILE